MNTRLFLLLIFFSVFCLIDDSTAQQPLFEVKGKVTDAGSNQSLEFATVALKKMRDSSLVSGTITNSMGEFVLTDIPPGGYRIEIAFIGYERIEQRLILRPNESPRVNDLGTIRLAVSAKLLEGAEITADKSFIINNIDKKTYNTDQLAVTAGGNVKDVLDNIPSVEVDADGNVSLRGNENVTILIDGRPSGLTGSGGRSLLESIPASAIENVEVITNPSAKYDPDGISGIINIVTKKNKLVGFTGSVGVNTSFENRYGGNIGLSYRKGPWNLYTNYGYNKDVRKFTGKSYRETYFFDTTEILRQNDIEENNRNNHNIKAGVDFNVNDHNTISAGVLFNTGTDNETGQIIYRSMLAGESQDSIYKRFSTEDGNNNNLDFDFAWKHSFKNPGRILNLTGTASLDKSSSDETFNQAGYINENDPIPYFPVFQRDFTREENDIYTGAADYEHPIGKDKKIEAGYKSTFRDFDTDYRAEELNQGSGVYENDADLTNHFIYNDQLHALYAQYRQGIKKFGFQVGVRSEFASTQSELVTTKEKFDKDYFSVFPSAFVTYKADEKTQLKASYSRRINRPSRRALNPFANYEDPLNVRKGNPFLDPEYTDSYELEFNRLIGRINFTATGYARLTTDYIQRYRQVTPEGVTITTFENLASTRNYGLEFIFNGNPYKWWNFTLSSNMYYNELDASNIEQGLNSKAFAVSGRVFTTIKFPFKSDLQLTYFYRAPMKLTQGTMKDMQMMTVAISKSVLKDKGNISARLSDPFNVQRFGFEFDQELYFQDITRKRQSRIFTLAFTYRFGEMRDRDNRPKREQPPREDIDMGF